MKKLKFFITQKRSKAFLNGAVCHALLYREQITLKEISQRLKMSQASLSRYFSGQGPVDIQALSRIAKLFGVKDPAILVDETRTHRE